MLKRLIKVPTFLVFMLLMYQLVFPIGNVMVSANTSMLPPSNLAFQTVTPDDGKLTWSAVFGATGYKVYEIKDGQLVVLGTTTATSFSLNDLPEGTYRYVVSTLSGGGESGPSAPVSSEIIYPDMQAPGSFTSTIQKGNDIVLSWGTSQYAQKYNVYQISEAGEKTIVTSTTAKTFTIVNSPGGSFTYAVSADNSLYGESAISEYVNVDVVYPEMTQPSNLSFTITNGTDVTLNWQASDYATGYKIYEVMDGQQELKTTVTGTSYKFTNLPAGDYVYKVSSFSDRFGESAEGSQISLTVSSIIMEAPTNVVYKILNTNDVALSWGSTPNATGYKVYQVIDGERILISTVTGTSVTYTMLQGGIYEYEIYSYNDRFGESELGSKVSFSIDTITINPPTNLSYKIENGNDIVINWGAAENASNYKVYQIIDGKKVLKNTVVGTSISFTNMPSGEYQFAVHTNSTRFGESKEAEQVSLTLKPISMSAPANATYEIKNENDLILKWDPVDYASYYKLYQVSDGKKVFKSYIWTPALTFTNLPEGEYHYEIHPYSTRFGESEKGAIFNINIVYPEVNSPENVIKTIKSPTSFMLSWDSIEYASYYKVYKIINGQKVFANNVFGTAVTYNDLKPGSYQYEIHSFSNRFGESKIGTPVEIKIDGPEMVPPDNVTNNITNGNDLTLKWNPVQYASSYNIYQNVNGELVLKRTVYSTTTTFTNMPEGEFEFFVKSNSNLYGESSDGAVAKGSIDYPILSRPENVTYSFVNGNDISLRWNPATFANSYKIYQIIDGEKVLQRTVTGTATTFVNMPEGDYSYEINSYSDRFGESPEANKLDLTIVFPIMQAPLNFTNSITNGNDIVLKWNASTYAKEYKVYQVINGEKTLIKTVTGTTTTLANMPEGNYSYEIHSYSDRFGESPEGSNLDLTLVFPIMQAPGNFTKTIANGNDIVLRWNASSYAKEYRIYQVIEGEKVLKRTVTTTSTTFINMPEGNYNYVVHSYSDRFGESPVGSVLEFNLTWPIVQAPVITGDVFNANNITLSWPAAAWANEYRVYKVNGDNKELLYKGTARSFKVYNLTEDTHSFEVTAYSTRFGESKRSNLVTETIVYPIMGVPSAGLKLLSDTSARISWDFVTYANGYNIYEIINGKPVLVAEKVNNLSYTLQNLTYANHLYYVTSYSNSFGESQPSETVLAKLIIDTTAPETKDNAPVKWVNQNQPVSLEATDDETGVANTFYSVNDGFITEGTSILVDQEGINKILYHSVDKVGNAEKVKTTFVKIDKTAPKTDINEIPPYAQSFTGELTGRDNLSGVAKTYYSINGSEYVEGTSFAVDQEGINEISYYSVDSAGNKEEVNKAKINIDKTAPITSAEAPETWVNDNVTVKLTPKDENSGVAKTYYSINGSEFIEGTNVVVEREGINRVSYYSVDAAENIEEINTVAVKIDKTKPATTADVPETWVKDNVTVTLNVNDEYSGIAKTYYSINGSEYLEGTTFVVGGEGINEITYYSVDLAGNREAVNTKKVKIDKSAPVTSYEGPSIWVKDDVAVSLTAADKHSGVAKTYYSINGSDFVEGTTFVIKQEGINEISYYSIDTAGNKEEVQSTEVKIDKTSPTVSVDLEDEYELGSTFTVDYLAQDNLSGITVEEVTINGQSYKKGDPITLDQPGEYKLIIKVTDNAGWTTVVEKSFVVYIPVTLEVMPKVIKENTGTFTVKATLPAKYQNYSFDASSVTLNGVSPDLSNKGLQKQAEKGQFKFEREDFDWSSGKENLEIRGYINGHYLVVGKTTVEVKGKEKK